MARVLFIPSWYPNRTASASGNFIRRLIEAIAPFDNISVLFVSPDSSLQKKYEVDVSSKRGFLEVIVYFRQVQSGSWFAMPAKILRRWSAYRLGMKEIKRHCALPQLIHVQAALPAVLYAWKLSRKLKIPYMVTEHSLGYQIYERTSLGEKLLFVLMKAAYRRAAKIVVVSKHLGDAMRKNGIRNNYLIIPNVVSLPDSPMPVNKAGSRKRILHISTLSEVKNARGIINAIKQVSLVRDDYELVIVSEADEQRELKEFVSAKGLTGTVKFLVFIDDAKELLDLIYSSNFMVLFSNYESFSIVLAESLWAGRPVITSRCGGPQEFITAEFGMLVEPGDEKELERAIIKMLDTSQNYDARKMSEFARSNFAPAIVGKRMHCVHEEIITDN